MEHNRHNNDKFKHIPTTRGSLPSLADFHNVLSQEEADAIRIKECLSSFGHINTMAVTVRVHKNIVYLEGMVSSAEQKDDAETIAWMCLPDANNVFNELSVGAGNDYKEGEEF